MRPRPARAVDADAAFLTGSGHAFISTTAKCHKDQVTIQFAGLLAAHGMARPGLSFYALRHTFRTVADAARDPVAIDLIMGHTTRMGATYRGG